MSAPPDELDAAAVAELIAAPGPDISFLGWWFSEASGIGLYQFAIALETAFSQPPSGGPGWPFARSWRFKSHVGGCRGCPECWPE
jgi:hypothetical protein